MHYMMQGCYKSHPGSSLRTSFFRDVHGHDQKVERFMDFTGRYHGPKGVPERLVEDGVLGNLAPPGDLEESASHNFL